MILRSLFLFIFYYFSRYLDESAPPRPPPPHFQKMLRACVYIEKMEYSTGIHAVG